MMVLRLREFLYANRALQFATWAKRGWSEPYPHFVKTRFLSRHSLRDAIWVETGTYLGTSTKFMRKNARHVYTFEPSVRLFEYNQRKFRGKNVSVINLQSERGLSSLLSEISGPINFWLDGHFSDGITFKGEIECPLLDELHSIATYMSLNVPLRIFIDDVRCFLGDDPQYSSYPNLSSILTWATDHEMEWRIEAGILLLSVG